MGLPNIVGDHTKAVGDYLGASSGAFSYTPGGLGIMGASSSVVNFNGNLNFDASRSNSIYGNSNTVTPLSTSTLMLMKY